MLSRRGRKWTTEHMMCLFQSTYSPPLQCPVSLFYIDFIHISLDLTLLFTLSCFKVISGDFGDFEVKWREFEASTVSSKMMHAYRSLSTHFKQFTQAQLSSKALGYFKDTHCNEPRLIRPKRSSIRSIGCSTVKEVGSK